MDKTIKVLRDHTAEIMEIWQGEVKKLIPASIEANEIALYDHMPGIISDIADIMERHDDLEEAFSDQKYFEIIENSKNHGRHRATSPLYTVDQIVHEYIIFHRTLTDFLKVKEAYDVDIADLMKYIIETSILKSVGSFTQSIREMQEKLIGTLAHDIRNPLAAAQLSLEMIKQDPKGMWLTKMRNAAERSVRKALGLVEGLMNSISVNAGEGMMLDFEHKNIVRDIEWVHSEAIEVYANPIHLECNKDSIIGVFDGTAVRRLLENLIGNAVKYGSPDQPITLSVTDKSHFVTISVHNYGNPISDLDQEEIFDFLGQKDKENQHVSDGWGIGLTLAHIVAEAHGGEITVDSSSEKGTTFKVILYKQYNKPGKHRTKLNMNVIAK